MYPVSFPFLVLERSFYCPLAPISLRIPWDRIEQGIGGATETAVDRVTKILQCVKVHLSNAPSVFFEHYSFGLAFASRLAFCFNTNQPVMLV